MIVFNILFAPSLLILFKHLKGYLFEYLNYKYEGLAGLPLMMDLQLYIQVCGSNKYSFFVRQSI